MERKSLSQILHGNDGFFDGWGDVQVAGDFGDVPPGTYVCHLTEAAPFEARTKGTPGFKLAFRIVEGEHTGRLVWYDIWLTEAAKPQAKRDFNKLGITDPKRQLEGPLPRWIRCAVQVVLRKGDDGNAYNRVKSFTVLGIDQPEPDPFAPGSGDAAEPPPGVPVDATFDPQAIEAEKSAGGDDGRF